MEDKTKKLIQFGLIAIAVAVFIAWIWRGDVAQQDIAELTGPDPVLQEPRTEKIPTVVIPKTIGWAKGEVPKAAKGLTVTRFAEGLDHPRTMLTLPNGDVLVALTNAPAGNLPGGLKGMIMGWLMNRAGAGAPSPDKIVLLRDSDGDGVADQRFILREGLSSPSGMGYHDGKLYVANHDALLAFDFTPGATRLTGEPKKMMDLPPAGGHWMRNLVVSPDGGALYVAVGAASNIGENGMVSEQGRAGIWEYDLARNYHQQFAGGLRNPNGLDFNPSSGELWTTVNERDQMGSDLVPDYLTNVPIGAQYGWPWVYWKDNMDFRVRDPIPQYHTEYTRKPEYALGPHVAALGMVFAKGGGILGDDYANGAFIARHGSWNRRPVSGYDVIFVPFDQLGNPVGQPKPVLTGFLDSTGDARGRPTWVAFDKAGALLVSDDTAGIIWRVHAPGAKPSAAPAVIESTPLPPQKELTGEATIRFKANPLGD